MVPIKHMRIPTAGVSQRQFKASWGNQLAKELDLDRLGIPVVNHRDGVFWVIDGQHRVYALRENGFGEYEIECEVYKNLSDEEMAAIFDGRNSRRTVHALDHFLVRCTAGSVRENGIRRVVESNGLYVAKARDKAENAVSCVSAMGRVYDTAGPVVLGRVLRAIKNAYGYSTSFDAAVVQGLGLLFHRYEGRVDEKEMTERMGDVRNGVRGIIQRAEALRTRTGGQKPQCVAAVLVDLYNKDRHAKHRIPSWWKEQE
jgi:hypothetical protein